MGKPEANGNVRNSALKIECLLSGHVQSWDGVFNVGCVVQTDSFTMH